MFCHEQSGERGRPAAWHYQQMSNDASIALAEYIAGSRYSLT
jgi:hypothetical protein